MELRTKPDFELAMNRVHAWFNRQVIDRPPIGFSGHTSDFSVDRTVPDRDWPDLKARWFDAEYQVDKFFASIQGIPFYGETFPMFCPNLGPNVYAAFYGAELEFGEDTSWVEHCIHAWDDISRLKFSPGNVYYQKIEELTRIALQKCPGEFMVGYTDMHASLDCAADWRNPQMLCMDLIDAPEKVHELVALAQENFLPLYDHYNAVLAEHGQPSFNWMGIPAFGKMHVPSCDFGSLISSEDFDSFYLPSLIREVKHTTHNIFHLDGKGMIRHLDSILERPEIQAIQWVQGVGDDYPIMQWLPVIKRIRAAEKSVVVNLQVEELNEFMASVNPEGIFLCVSAPVKIQPDIIKRLETWT